MTTRGGFQAEYAKTSRSACKGCGSTIKQGKLRVGKETPSSFRDGWDLSWYHLKCAPTYKKSSEIAGFDWLRWDDQLDIKKRVKEDTTETPDIKRHKKEVDQLWDLIDDLDSNVNSKTLKGLLEANGFKIEKVTPARLLHKAADGLLWGRIGDCPDCASASTLRYTGYTYECKGWFSEFTRCTFKGTEGVKRYAFKIPSAYKKDFSFFTFPKTHPKEDYKASKKKDSDSVSSSESESSSEEEEIDESIKEDKIPEGQEMYGMNVMIIGTKRDLGMSQAEIRDMIEEHGGEVDVSLLSDTRFIIASESEVKKKTKSKKLQQGLTAGLPVFSVDYITDLCEESQTKLRERSNAKKYLIGGKLDKPLCVRYNLELIKKREEKEKLKEEKEQKKQEKENKKKKAVQKKKKTLPPLPGSDILKVDADSELDKVGEILVTNTDRYGYTCYNVMLNQTDLDSGVNKFYRIQLIKKKGKAAWHVWTSWGRIGTSRGDNGLYDFKSESKAIDFFAKKFFERTHVQWEDRDTFQKQKGHYFMVSLDDGNEELSSEDEDDDDEKSNKPSARMRKKLKQEVDPKEEKEEMDTEEPIPPRVQQLVQLIFDKDMINNALKSMDIDVEKMPLGKISKKQIKNAYGILDNIQTHLDSNDEKRAQRLRDESTQFYFLIPHDFGNRTPPVIDSHEMLEKKVQLLDTLCDIEIAASVMKGKLDENDPIRQNYNKLNTKLTPLDKKSETYKLLERYALDSHDNNWFMNMKFEIEDIFEVEREGEAERFKPWAKNDNRMLLWHGSRLTNWVGILSTGLRIAPPEAPKTGYRFGKGVYLADCISKSASYCFTNSSAPTSCMLLAESALGTMNELKKDQYMEKPPQGTHSTKALGKYAPSGGNHSKYTTVLDNVVVPQGKIQETGVKSTCSHNEYIIYDVSQILIRYLFRIRFKY